MATIADAAGTRTMAYDAHLRPTTETFGTLHDGRILTRTYETHGRPSGIQVGTVGDPDEDQAVTYGYDTAGRLNTVTDPRDIWTYSFLANSNLPASVSSASSVPNYSYENNRDVLTSVENKVGSTTILDYAYTVNRINQRTERSQSGDAFSTASTDTFGYNALGEVIASENDQFTAREFGCDYDLIGNRLSHTVASGTPTLYSVNALNQYIEIEQSPTPAVEPSHDLDGNMTADGKGNTLVWDGENRLIELFPVSPSAGDTRVVNTYDGQSRRVQKQVYEWSSGWQLTKDEVFLYGGWNPVVIYETEVSDLSPQLFLTWGRDLSGSMQGAGGVGGLLATYDNTTEARFFYDGNGNVGQLVAPGTGSVIAAYEYDPFGNLVASTGSYADTNAYRFSTKFLDEETGYYYYGYRFYNPETGRWPNRDPIEEAGGLNLYGFVGNNGVNQWDYLGQCGGWESGSGNHHVPNRDLVDTEIQRCRVMDTLPIFGWHRFFILPSGETCGGTLGMVLNPDPYYAGVVEKGTEIRCSPLKLSPCRYDSEKFVRCVERNCSTSGYTRVRSGGNCIDTNNALLDDCREESKRF